MYLVIVKGKNAGATMPIGKVSPILIGRGEECTIKLLDIMASRKHCLVEWKDGAYYIKDLNSTNRTIVNSKAIDDEVQLRGNDIIELGSTMILCTSQKDESIKSVADYDLLIKSRTRRIDTRTEVNTPC